MNANPLAARGCLLEEDYFNRLQAEQLARLRDDNRREEMLRELGAALGIEEESFLDSLIELGITFDTAAAFEALPLVEVAWADGDVDSQERWHVLALANAFGLELGRPGHAQLELWLKRKPEKELFEAWYQLASSGLATPASTARSQRILEGAREVANVAGGILGFWTVSSSERAAISRIRQALGGSPASADPN
jgi:tellurite resistance protein